jgi:prevent-host-death family protein
MRGTKRKAQSRTSARVPPARAARAGRAPVAGRTIGATEFKARCLELMDELASRGGEIVVTKRGRAVARVLPVVAASLLPLRGLWKGEGRITGDLLDLGLEWEMLE